MIHQYKLGDYNIVLDICSGSVHVVDEVAYEIIALYETTEKAEILVKMHELFADREDITDEDIEECYEQVKGLADNRQLFTPDTYAPKADTLKRKSGNIIKALCIHIAHTCNLNCSYCFASQGKYHGDRAMMSFEVGKRALDFLIENSGSRTNL